MTPHQKIQKQKVLTRAHHDYQKKLNAHAFFKVNDKAIGEDLVQETFAKTWRYLLKGGKIDFMESFLYHVLGNLIVDQYRKRKTISLDVLVDNGFEARNDDQEHLLNFLDGKLSVRLIQRLPVKYQKVVHMRYVQDLTLKEMSHITGLSKHTLSVQMYRGLGKLKLLHK